MPVSACFTTSLQRDLGITEKENNNANNNHKITVNCKGINKSNED